MNKLLELIEDYGVLSCEVGLAFARQQDEKIKELYHQKAKVFEEIQKIIEAKERQDD